MVRSAVDRVESAKESNTNFAIRQGACLCSLLLHVSLFWGLHSPVFWAFALFQGLAYPALLHLTPALGRRTDKKILLDCLTYGGCLGIWGFNPFLIAAYLSAIGAITTAAGGLRLALRGGLLVTLGALVGGAVWGFYFRSTLSGISQTIATSGLIFLLSALGLNMHKINSRLVRARNTLSYQREELLNLNTLALAVNAHLEVDIILQRTMQIIESLYPFEALYILALDDEQKQLKVSGIYGSLISESEHDAFRQFKFDLERDKDSLFVKSLAKGKVVHLPEITDVLMSTGAPIDQDLYRIKPSVSLAYFPVYVEDRTIAGAAFLNYTRNLYLNQSDLERIQQYLVQVGTAVRNASLFRDLIAAKANAESAQKKAEASDETKSRFLANMSHEIRTPLTAILGYSDALQDEDVSSTERKQFIDYITRSGNHLLNTINDILDISKIEVGKIEVELLRCELTDILFDIDTYTAAKARDKQLHYELCVNYPIPKTLTTDPTRLKQILFNLCNNAVKFTRQGTIALKLEWLAGRSLRIDIRDSGIGIDRSEAARIFTAFDQADTSTTRLFGGSGLGLFISKNLAQLLGGDLTFTSTKGVGSTFTLTLPATDDPDESIGDDTELRRQMRELEPAAMHRGPPQLKGEVLVVEDNRGNRDVIARLLRQTGLKVQLVDNGARAVAAAARHKFTAVLMDMQMPLMDGREAFERIRQTGNTVPVIAFTANVMKHQIDDYYARGFSGVIEKPIIPEKLFKTLEALSPPSCSAQTFNAPQLVKQVLIVEDDQVNQMILTRYVRKACDSAEVVIASNGQEALAQVKAGRFALIFMDKNMPVMNGIDATRAIRALGNTVPLYIVSGDVSQQDVDQSLAVGASGHIAKPLDKHRLMQLIAHALGE